MSGKQEPYWLTDNEWEVLDDASRALRQAGRADLANAVLLVQAAHQGPITEDQIHALGSVL